MEPTSEADRKALEFIDGGLTRIECRILNRFNRKRLSAMKGNELVCPLQLNQTHVESLIEKGIVKKGVAYQATGRPPVLFTLTEVGHSIVSYMKTQDITIQE